MNTASSGLKSDQQAIHTNSNLTTSGSSWLDAMNRIHAVVPMSEMTLVMHQKPGPTGDSQLHFQTVPEFTKLYSISI